ncbi:hypothetical protein Tco_0572931 [Tanacetum coccineum]
MYLTASRPDIMYAVCVCSRFQVTPKTSHLNAVKRIFKYLKGKPHLGLWYPRESPFDLEAFSDSDYGGSNLDRKSTTGGCQFLGQRLISWQCKKQTIVATSTTELKCSCSQIAGFADKVDFLRGSNLRYALSANPTVYDSLVKQFWQSATANTKVDGSLEINATIDTIRYTISEASIRESLQLEDATGITMLPNKNLLREWANRYPYEGTFTFWKIQSPPPIPTPTPPHISTPTPPPIPIPTPPPIPTLTPPSITTPTPIPDNEPTPDEHIYEEQSPIDIKPGNGSQTNQADHGKCNSEKSEDEEPKGGTSEEKSQTHLNSSQNSLQGCLFKVKSIDKEGNTRAEKKTKGKKVNTAESSEQVITAEGVK